MQKFIPNVEKNLNKKKTKNKKMDTQLTVNINSRIIEGAKLYAKENRISLSELVENYLSSLIKSYYAMEKKQLISDLTESFEDIKLHEQGKIKLKSLKEVVNEL